MALAAGMLTSGEASAAAIIGLPTFTGTATLNGPLSTATSFTSFDSVQVESGTGDYAVPSLVPLHTAVTITAFSFEPFTPVVAPLWTFNVGGTDYSLDLSTLSVSRMTLGENHFLNLSGKGTARADGFESSPADFSFSAQQSVNAVGNTVTFSVENVVPGIPVPEPGALVLVAGALLAVAGGRRRGAA